MGSCMFDYIKKQKILFILLLYLIAIMLPMQAKQTATQKNSKELVGLWNITDEAGNIIDQIDIDLAVAGSKSTRFAFEQLSLNNQVETEPLQGYLMRNLVVFDLIRMGYTQTYVFKVDFDLGGGTGFEIKTQTADCSTDFSEIALLAKKDKAKVNEFTRLCKATLSDSVVRDVKLVQANVAPSIISGVTLLDPKVIKELNTNRKRLEGNWNSSRGKSLQARIAVQNIETNDFGYSFDYRLIDKKQNLRNFKSSSFVSGVRKGFLIDDYMIYNTSTFGSANKLNIVGLQARKGNGRELITPNGRCLTLKGIAIDEQQACTANHQDESVETRTKVSTKLRVDKLKSRFLVNF